MFGDVYEFTRNRVRLSLLSSPSDFVCSLLKQLRVLFPESFSLESWVIKGYWFCTFPHISVVLE